MRIAFDLLDEAGHYHGDGHQEIWVYPEAPLHTEFRNPNSAPYAPRTSSRIASNSFMT